MGNSVEIMMSEEERKQLEFIAMDIFPKTFYDAYKRTGAYDEYKRWLEESAKKTQKNVQTQSDVLLITKFQESLLS
jgi:hypothetical protein